MSSREKDGLKIACFCVAKNAEAYIEEWIAYQLNVGFDTIIIFDNLSTDATRERVMNFIHDYDVRYFSWSVTGPLYQRLAHKLAVIKFRSEFDWIAFLDVDEFIVLPKDRNLRYLLNLPAKVSAVALPWCFFGSNGLIEKPDGMVIRSFLRCSVETFSPNRIIKSIARPRDIYRIPGPHGFGVLGSYVNLNKKIIPRIFFQLENDPDFTFGKLHHYFVKSKADWVEKLERGYGDITRGFDEFYTYDRNEVLDESALLYEGGTKAILEKVKCAQRKFDKKVTRNESLPSRSDLLKIFFYFEIRSKIYKHFLKYIKSRDI